MEIFRANYQWANRPEDERFTSLAAMHKAVKDYASQARESDPLPWVDLRVEATDKDLRLVGKAGIPAVVSHYAFGQLAARAGAPPAYIRTLPSTLAAQNVNYGLANRKVDGPTQAQLLFHDRNGSGLLLRAATSDQYKRFWNWEVTERLLDLQSRGWTPGGPDFAFEGLPHSADPDLYASDHDMFAFIRHPDKVIDDGTEYGLRRGLIVGNSEVGDCALWALYFLYRYQCGNHIIWGAQDVKKITVAHRGSTVAQHFDRYVADAVKIVESSASGEEQAIAAARRKVIGKDKEEVLDALFGKTILSRKQLGAGYDAVKEEEDGAANTVWGFVQGLTRYSQTVPYADTRTEIDKAAGKVLKIAF